MVAVLRVFILVVVVGFAVHVVPVTGLVFTRLREDAVAGIADASLIDATMAFGALPIVARTVAPSGTFMVLRKAALKTCIDESGECERELDIFRRFVRCGHVEREARRLIEGTDHIELTRKRIGGCTARLGIRRIRAAGRPAMPVDAQPLGA